jgi:Membrane-associating domain
LQLLFALVVLGVSISLAKGQVFGAVPARTGFNAAVGALATLASVVGILAVMFDKLPEKISLGLDLLTALALLAGGIVSTPSSQRILLVQGARHHTEPTKSYYGAVLTSHRRRRSAFAVPTAATGKPYIKTLSSVVVSSLAKIIQTTTKHMHLMGYTTN